jgi:hypothetical protein
VVGIVKVPLSAATAGKVNIKNNAHVIFLSFILKSLQ